MRQNIYAVFPTVESAQSALGALFDHGAKAEDVSLIVREPYANHYDGRMETATDVKHAAEQGITTTTGADAASGAAKGLGIGLGVGAVAALASLVVPGVGLVVGGGALAAALAGAAGTTAAGAVAGGVTGFLKDQGVDEDRVAAYADSFETGAAIVGISVPSGPVDGATAEGIYGKYQDSKILTTEAIPPSVPTY